ncbi:hypothetical protein GH5_02645 [Leishmania sp. Ghana 2012 LV757]|uniref:hypothetical protein n=1 Tax=Leishmania sp. Ghana 2012 LV757 TaxID=2803181 RepID=UPI001B5ABC69|nr:hypothetical protein GH5_02645 [Leishmania sp. Ghana 2012 LV757]
MRLRARFVLYDLPRPFSSDCLPSPCFLSLSTPALFSPCLCIFISPTYASSTPHLHPCSMLRRAGTSQLTLLHFICCLHSNHYLRLRTCIPAYIQTPTSFHPVPQSPSRRQANRIMSNSGSVSVAAQAELMEKEKTVTEHQQRLESLRHTVKTMATRQVTLKRAERRCQITVGELTKLKPEHVVYQGIGRAFMRAPVNKLIDLNNEEIERCEAEENRLSNEKLRTSELVTKEEGELRRAIEEFRAALMVVQAAQSRSQRSE